MTPAKTAKTRSDGEQKSAAPSISLPKGGGAIRGMCEKFAANPVTGTGWWWNRQSARSSESRVNDVDPSEGRQGEVCVPAAAAVVARRFRGTRQEGEVPATVRRIEERARLGPVGRGLGERRFESSAVAAASLAPRLVSNWKEHRSLESGHRLACT